MNSSIKIYIRLSILFLYVFVLQWVQHLFMSSMKRKKKKKETKKSLSIDDLFGRNNIRLFILFSRISSRLSILSRWDLVVRAEWLASVKLTVSIRSDSLSSSLSTIYNRIRDLAANSVSHPI